MVFVFAISQFVHNATTTDYDYNIMATVNRQNAKKRKDKNHEVDQESASDVEQEIAVIKKTPYQPKLTCCIHNAITAEEGKMIEWRYGRYDVSLEELKDRVTGFYLLPDRTEDDVFRVVVERCKALDDNNKPVGRVLHIFGSVFGKVEDLPETTLHALTQLPKKQSAKVSPLLASAPYSCHHIEVIDVVHDVSVKTVIPMHKRREPTLQGFLTKPIALFFWRPKPDTDGYNLYLEIPNNGITPKDKVFVQIAYDIKATAEAARAAKLAAFGEAYSGTPREPVM